MGLASMRGSCERGRIPSPWELPSLAGRSTRTERELKRLRQEYGNYPVTFRMERDKYKQFWPPHYILRYMSASVWGGLGPETLAS